MPRSRPYSIEMSASEELELLRRSVKYTLPYFEVLRAKMVLLASQGLSNAQIAADSTPAGRSSACGGSVSSKTASLVWMNTRARVVPGFFPPELLVQIKAFASELPSAHGIPLSHWNTPDLVRQVCNAVLVASISGSTI